MGNSPVTAVSKSSQYKAPPTQSPATPELLELDDELLELELELEDELLELLELDDELLEEDELELLVPEEPLPPQADNSSAKHIKIKGCFMRATDILL